MGCVVGAGAIDGLGVEDKLAALVTVGVGGRQKKLLGNRVLLRPGWPGEAQARLS